MYGKLFIIIFSTLISFSAWSDEAKLTWLGHAAFLYKSASGTTFLIDPWVTNPKAPKDFKIPKVDAILVTHGHSDHLGEAFAIAQKQNIPILASHELTEIAKKKGVKQVVPINQSGSATFGKVTITATEAIHSSSFEDGDQLLYAGAALGFIIQEKGSPTIYDAGDTGVFGDMAEIRALYHPDVALLPIGGVYTMKPYEAATAVRMLGVKAVVPMHYGTFPALAGTPEELKNELKGEKSKVHVMIPGVEVVVRGLYK